MSQPQTTTLPNGLRIITSEIPNAQTVAIAIMIKVGGRYEQYQVNGGVAHFLEHLLFKGTKKRPSTHQIAAAIDAVGGYQNAYTDYDHTCYHVKLPAAHLKLGFDVLADMVTGSLLKPEEVARERGTVIEEMRMERDNPADFVATLTPPLLWPNSSLAHELIGSEEVISSITVAEVERFYHDWYVPNNMLISVAGATTHKEVVTQTTQLLGDLPSAKVGEYAPVGPDAAKQTASTLERDTNQTHLSLSARVPGYDHADMPALTIAATLLGRGLSSRLYINIRERQGLAYHISADIQSFVDTGDFSIYAGVNLDNTAAAIQAIRQELQRLIDEPLSDEELSKAKQQIRGYTQMALEDNAIVAQRYGSHWLVYDRVRTPEESLRQIDAVTAEDVARVAKSYLSAKHWRLGLIAPQAQIDAAQQTFATLE